jgi:hypothetical protein
MAALAPGIELIGCAAGYSLEDGAGRFIDTEPSSKETRIVVAEGRRPVDDVGQRPETTHGLCCSFHQELHLRREFRLHGWVIDA